MDPGSFNMQPQKRKITYPSGSFLGGEMFSFPSMTGGPLMNTFPSPDESVSSCGGGGGVGGGDNSSFGGGGGRVVSAEEMYRMQWQMFRDRMSMRQQRQQQQMSTVMPFCGGGGDFSFPTWGPGPTPGPTMPFLTGNSENFLLENAATVEAPVPSATAASSSSPPQQQHRRFSDMSSASGFTADTPLMKRVRVQRRGFSALGTETKLDATTTDENVARSPSSLSFAVATDSSTTALSSSSSASRSTSASSADSSTLSGFTAENPKKRTRVCSAEAERATTSQPSNSNTSRLRKEDDEEHDDNADEDDEPIKPKRALSAYNLFFRHERARLLLLLESSSSSTSSYSPPRELDLEHVRHLLENNPYHTDRSSRRHRKSHGKVSFMDLVKSVSSGWKQLDRPSRCIFDHLAKEEKARYRRKNQEYKRIMRERDLARKERASSLDDHVAPAEMPTDVFDNDASLSALSFSAASSSSSSSWGESPRKKRAEMRPPAERDADTSDGDDTTSAGETQCERKKGHTSRGILQEALRLASDFDPIQEGFEGGATTSVASAGDKGSSYSSSQDVTDEDLIRLLQF